MKLTVPQKKIYEFLIGKKDVPTQDVGFAIYAKFFNSEKLQTAAADRILKELHKLNLVVKHYSYTNENDVWSIKNDSTENS